MAKQTKIARTPEEEELLDVLQEIVSEIDSVTVVDELELAWEDRAKDILNRYGRYNSKTKG